MNHDLLDNEGEVEVLAKPSLFGMILEPKTQFERMQRNPKILVPFIIVTVLTIIGMLLMMSQIDFIGDDPLLNGMEDEELMIVTIFSQIAYAFTGLVMPAISILLSTVVYFIIAKIVKSEVTFKQLFSMSVFIYIISVFGLLVNGLAFLAMSNPNLDLYLTSLNSIVEADGILGVILVSIEVFSIWGMVLTAIGLQIVANFSKGLSWSIVVGIFVVILLFAIGGQLVTDMLGAY